MHVRFTSTCLQQASWDRKGSITVGQKTPDVKDWFASWEGRNPLGVESLGSFGFRGFVSY